jgi:hypothetical protein
MTGLLGLPARRPAERRTGEPPAGLTTILPRRAGKDIATIAYLEDGTTEPLVRKTAERRSLSDGGPKS